MRKRIKGKTLSRTRTARKALYRSLVRSLVQHNAIKTTLAKAKFVQPMVDKLVTYAKKGSLNGIKALSASLGNDAQTVKLLLTTVKNFSRTSGFTRIVKLSQRKGDAARMVRIEWVDEIIKPKIEKLSKKEKGKNKPNKIAKTAVVVKK